MPQLDKLLEEELQVTLLVGIYCYSNDCIHGTNYDLDIASILMILDIFYDMQDIKQVSTSHFGCTSLS